MKRSAFTLVELLVVIAVIAILAAILIPAVNMARETARRGQCTARQRDLAIAMITYDKDNNGLPGYLNQLGETPIHSWAVAVFPMIGENKRYEFLMENSPPYLVSPPIEGTNEYRALVSPPSLLCPSDDPREKCMPRMRPAGLTEIESGRLNYVVNCGPAAVNGINGDVAPAFTLFKDRRRTPIDLTSINKKAEIAEIPDGASNTILLTENADAGLWHQDWQSPNELPTSSGTATRDSNAVKNFGFIWGTAAYALNSSKPSSEEQYPRPSSKHPATVIAAFADGSAKAINDDIALAEWLQAVCPDDEKAKKPVNGNGLGLSL